MDEVIFIAQAVALIVASVLGVLCVAKKPMRNRWVAGVLYVWGAYTLLYIALSLNGRYEPSIIGLNGVKCYDWAPKGFVRDYKWSSAMMRTFSLYHMLDNQLWHKYGSLEEIGHRPVNEVKVEDIWKVYHAWDTGSSTDPCP